MKIKKDVDALIKENYIGSIVSFENDMGRFFSIKRALKKHNAKNNLTDLDTNVKSLLNQLSSLRNIFKTDIVVIILEDILEDDEYLTLQSVLFASGLSNISVNPELETKIKNLL